jgi:hypothetical protein
LNKLGTICDRTLEYYIVEIQLHAKSYFCLWYYGDKDSYFYAPGNKIMRFENITELKQYCYDNNMILTDEPEAIYNFDIVEKWLPGDRMRSEINCKFFLDIWNILLDMTHSVQSSFYNNDISVEGERLTIYNKLFLGCNLPAVKKEGEEYVPTWSFEEINLLSQIIKRGLQIANLCFSAKRTKG